MSKTSPEIMVTPEIVRTLEAGAVDRALLAGEALSLAGDAARLLVEVLDFAKGRRSAARQFQDLARNLRREGVGHE